MSNGPIEIQPYPHNSLLESSQKQYDFNPDQEFPSSQIEAPQSDVNIINSGPCRDHFRQKRPLNTDNYHTQSDLPYNEDLINESDRFKKHRTQSNYPNFTHSAPQTSSIFTKPHESNNNIENSDFFNNGSKYQINRRAVPSSNLASHNENTNDSTSESNISQIKSCQQTPGKTCLSLQANETTNAIIHSIKHAQSLDQAHHSINTLVNDLCSKLESRMNEILHIERKAHEKLTETKFRELIHERDNSNLKINSLVEQLQSERQESMSKDQTIEELNKDLLQTQASMDQIKASIETYLKNQSLWVYKGCGLNERFPPDVY